ncbi:YciI family protein [Demequina sp. SO4-13]|uniref:YciI family protein n=1 Tax=Demequina sp. SO4-13 TaxID=3401027 RepID=UPI003AF56777
MAQFALMVHDRGDGPAPTPERMADFGRRVGALERDMSTDGVWVFGAGLAPASEANTVTADAVVTEGPFAQSGEHIAGIWVIEVPTLAAAQSWAARTADACGAPIEVRPLHGG